MLPTTTLASMLYDEWCQDALARLKEEGRYREFMDLSRVAGSFPHARHVRPNKTEQDVIMWCSNDYLGMGQHPRVLDAMHAALDAVGAGAGGTRNIGGTNHYHVQLEHLLADWYAKEAALLFTSGYTSNEGALSALGRIMPDCVFFSDALNHASMIAGMRASGAEKCIFKHNDLADLEAKLQAYPRQQAKIIAFESVYSMDGDVAPIKAICDLAEQYNAMTYLDEVHAVGMYGATGTGYAEQVDQRSRITLIQGTLGKAIGVVGGYITGSHVMMDAIRSMASAFIFTTSMPPVIAAGAIASITHLREAHLLRQAHLANANRLKNKLRRAGLPLLATDTHIVPLMVRHARCCKRVSDALLYDYGIYLQPINYPTVPRGSERLRITPTVHHTEPMMDALLEALQSIWAEHAIEQFAALA